MNWWQRLTPLAVAVLLLGAAAARVGTTESEGSETGAAMLWGVGFVFLGAWLALEIWHWRDRSQQTLDVSSRSGGDGEDEGTT